jgi:hypothetical protein
MKWCGNLWKGVNQIAEQNGEQGRWKPENEQDLYVVSEIWSSRTLIISTQLVKNGVRAWRRIATSQGQDKAKMIWLWVRTT